MNPPVFDPCHRCRGIDVVVDNAAGDVVCRTCGEIQMGRLIDSRAEWREFEDDGKGDSAARSSCSVDKFGSTSTYFHGGESKQFCKTLAKCQILSTDKRELKLMHAVDLIDDIGAKLNLTRKILLCARELCNRLLMQDGPPRRHMDQVAAALISLACRMEGHARTLQEISVATGLDLQIISKMQTVLARELGLQTGRVSPESIVPRIIWSSLVTRYIFAPASTAGIGVCPGTTPSSSSGPSLSAPSSSSRSHRHACNSAAAASSSSSWSSSTLSSSRPGAVSGARESVVSIELNADEICKKSSEGGVLDGIPPQSVAVAAVVFSAACLSAAAAMAHAKQTTTTTIAPTLGSSAGNSTCPVHQPPAIIMNAKLLDIEKAMEVSFANATTVKKAYTQLLLNAELVMPAGVMHAMRQCQRVRDWSAVLPTYDAFRASGAKAIESVVESASLAKVSATARPVSTCVATSSLRAVPSRIASTTTSAPSSSSRSPQEQDPSKSSALVPISPPLSSSVALTISPAQAETQAQDPVTVPAKVSAAAPSLKLRPSDPSPDDSTAKPPHPSPRSITARFLERGPEPRGRGRGSTIASYLTSGLSGKRGRSDFGESEGAGTRHPRSVGTVERMNKMPRRTEKSEFTEDYGGRSLPLEIK